MSATTDNQSPVPSIADYEQARQRHVRALAERLPAEIERVTWPLERLHALRDERLRALVRSALGHVPAIAAYQVRQTARGASIAVELGGAVDLEPVRHEVAAALARLGLATPEVVVARVDRIERTAVRGKVKRFVPLASPQGMVSLPPG